MWGKHKGSSGGGSAMQAAPLSSSNSANSASPFFPALEPRVRTPTRIAQLQQQQASFSATREREQLRSSFGSSQGGWDQSQREEEAKESPAATRTGGSQQRSMGASHSTDSLHRAGRAPQHTQQQRGMHASASAASFPTSHNVGHWHATDPVSHSSPYAPSVASVAGFAVAPRAAPSNQSSKLATKNDKWSSVDELLNHSHAMLTQAAHNAASSAGGLDPALMVHISAGSEPAYPLVAKPLTALQKKALAATRSAAAPPIPAPTRSPFATIAPPPLPARVQPSWGGLNPAPTAGLAHATQLARESSPDAPFGSEGAASKLLDRVGQRMRAMERAERAVAVHPSVLFAAGLVDEDDSVAAAGGGGQSTSPKKGGGQHRAAHPTQVSSSMSASERLWAQHQRMMKQARDVLPPSLRRGTQKQVVAAIQSLQPRTLLSIFSPQLHVLSVTLAELQKLVREDDKEKALLLGHLLSHQNLITEVLALFTAVSCQTLQNDDDSGNTGDSSAIGGLDLSAAAASGEGNAGGIDDLFAVQRMKEALRHEAAHGVARSSTLASLIHAPTEFGEPVASPESSPFVQPQQHGPTRADERHQTPQRRSHKSRREAFDAAAATAAAAAEAEAEAQAAAAAANDEAPPAASSFPGSLRYTGEEEDDLPRSPRGREASDDMHAATAGAPLRQIDETSEVGSPFATPARPSPNPNPNAPTPSFPAPLSSLESCAHASPGGGGLLSLDEDFSPSSGSEGHGAPSADKWELERWRRNLLSVRTRELAQEQSYIHCIQLLSALSQLRAEEMEEIQLTASSPLTGTTAGASSTSASDKETYARVHGSRESHRAALQSRLDALKIQLEPTYASKFVRHHQMIVSIEDMEAEARREREEAAAVAKEQQEIQRQQQQPQERFGHTETTSASALSLQLTLLRKSEAHHTTNSSAFTSSTEGGRAHRLPHSLWLSTSVPSSALVGMPDGDAGPLRGVGPAGVASAALLREARIRSLVHLENLQAAAAEKQGQLLDSYRALARKHAALQAWQASSTRAAAETAALTAKQLSDAAARLASESAARAQADAALEAARFEIVERDVKIESLYTELASLSYTVKQLQTTYTAHALFKPLVLDEGCSTEEGVTGVEQGGWDGDGRITRTREERKQLPDAGAVLSEEETAVLAAQGLIGAHPQLQMAALVAAAANASQNASSGMPAATPGPPPTHDRRQSFFGGGSPSANANAAVAAATALRKSSVSAAAPGSSGGVRKSVAPPSSGASSGAPSALTSSGSTPAGSGRSPGGQASPRSSAASAGPASRNSSAGVPSRRTQSMSLVQGEATSAAAAAAAKQAQLSRMVESERGKSQRGGMPSLAEGQEH